MSNHDELRQFTRSLFGRAEETEPEPDDPEQPDPRKTFVRELFARANADD